VSASVAAATARPAVPILFLDTCSVLEPLRFVSRPRPNLVAEVEAVQRALTAASSTPTQLHLVGAEVMHEEFVRNKLAILEESARYIDSTRDAADHLHLCEAAINGSIQAASALPPSQLAQSYLDLAESVLDRIQLIEEVESIRSSAFSRERHAVGPASKGKKCLNDCIIAETLLDFAGALTSKPRPPIVFLTYNYKDFSSGGAKPHADLADDFAALGIQLALSWTWAAHSAPF
jgi:hypothetical protein